MLTALALGVALLAPADFNFYQYGPYDTAFSTPERTLTYAPGEQHTTYMQQQATLENLEKSSSGRVKQFVYGKSTEGRPLRIFIVGSPENMARLDTLREGWEKLAHGEAADVPALVWINENIHGNESASFESSMWLLYTLASSRSEYVTNMLKDTVVIVNPCYNPDGHERFVVWYNSIAVGSPREESFEQNEPRIIHGRTNHYRFDMNRDRVAMSQVESRQETKVFRHWNPHVYVDQHGEVDGYFFPPNSMATNAAMDRDRLEKWTDIFGRGNAKAFDANGWTYFIRDTFDFFFVGYLDTYAMLGGAIGMTYETNGGGVLAREDDGEKVTLRDGMARHFTAALATIDTAAKNRKTLIDDYVLYKKRNISGELAGSFKRVVMTSEDPRALVRLAEQLELMGVESKFVTRAFSQSDAHDYWGDLAKKTTVSFPVHSLIVDMAQPYGMMAKSVLEPNAEFEKPFIERQMKRLKEAPKDEEYPGWEGGEFYDITGWSIPYAHGLKAWWCESAPQVTTVAKIAKIGSSSPDSTVGWALRYRDRDDILAAFDLAAQGVRVAVAMRDMAAGTTKYPRGTFVILAGRNDDDVKQKIVKVAEARRVDFEALTSNYPAEGTDGPGSSAVRRIKKPEVGVVFGSGDATTSFGSTWYLMEKEFKLPFTPLSGFRNLDKYSCIVAPSGRHTMTPQLKQWVQSGGCLVILESPGWAVGKDRLLEMEEKSTDFPIPGALFRAQLEPRLFTTYGYAGADVAVPIDGSSFFSSKKTGGGAVSVSKDEKSKALLSGWSWPDETEKVVKGTVWLHDEPLGRGHIIVFTNDPTSRAMWPGLHKMLLNAMLLGAG